MCIKMSELKTDKRFIRLIDNLRIGSLIYWFVYVAFGMLYNNYFDPYVLLITGLLHVILTFIDVFYIGDSRYEYDWK